MTQFESRRHSLCTVVLAVLCLPAVALPDGPLAAEAVHPVPISAKKAAQLVVHQPAPEYPPLALVNYIQGRVRLGIEVAADGKVARAHVVDGFPLLAASALETIRRWTYRPLITAAGPSAFLTTVVVNYSLRMHIRELTPVQAQRDLRRQVKPPQVIRRPADSPSKTVVHLHLLLNDKGQVIDSEPSLEAVSKFPSGQNNLEGWSFRPARWGNLPLPWYLDIDLPISETRLPQAATYPESHGSSPVRETSPASVFP
jgi:TonB family protein